MMTIHPEIGPSVDAFVQYDDCWPDGQPFPFTAEECKALVMGYTIRLKEPIDKATFRLLPGKWQGGGTFVVLWRA